MSLFASMSLRRGLCLLAAATLFLVCAESGVFVRWSPLPYAERIVRGFSAFGPIQGPCPNLQETQATGGQPRIAIKWFDVNTGRDDELLIPRELLAGISLLCASASAPTQYVGSERKDAAFALEVELPDFAPRSPANAERFVHGSHLQWSSMKLLVHDVLKPADTDGLRAINAKGYDISKDIYLNDDSLSIKQGHFGIANKGDLFGLKRIGVVGDAEPFHHAWGGAVMEDLLAPPDGPEDIWLMCQSSEIKDVSKDPTWERRPPCEMHIYDLRLHASVEASFPRTYLSRWKEMEGQIRKLMMSIEKLSPTKTP